ncbi:WD40 repeat domain-containing protein [Polyangium sp. y55x31]|uniref:WD40 repeat domain-containing protein n=1 Tax=Polyangium sp. y55x31 TaxID=3042688 RepID=UPI00248236A3|nr:WD40 repeat domain-containing protein [Polyangium sp. y55x31]MDI1483605.1 WD40 repeat domain-containing protein [Polyangium sp. y55x31]
MTSDSSSPSLQSPYPLLDPIEDPELFKGRDKDGDGSIEEVVEKLSQDKLILCFYAPSGTGKTSFLSAGLRPAFQGKRPVALETRPHEPRLAKRLLGRLGRDVDVPDNDASAFVKQLHEFCDEGPPPVIILDRFEAALQDEDGKALARIGLLLAATANSTRPGGESFACHWVLAFRAEHEGVVEQWLHNVLLYARRHKLKCEGLPHDLSSKERYFDRKQLRPFGSAAPGEDGEAVARRAFLAAIEAPLAMRDSSQRRRYALEFEGDSAKKIADAFAAYRVKPSRAPLTSELQIVLDRLWNSTTPSQGMMRICVNEEPGALIQGALADHLHRKLTAAFALGTDESKRRDRKTRAFMALLDLAREPQGQGLDKKSIEAPLGKEAALILERLEHHEIRLLRQEKAPDLEVRYFLAHDGLAAPILELENDPRAQLEHGLDEELLALRNVVTTHVELHERGHSTGTELSEELYRRVKEQITRLPSTQRQDAWWAKCVAKMETAERRQQRQLLLVRRIAMAACVILALAALAVYLVIIPERYRAAIHHAASLTEPSKADASWAEASAAYRSWSSLPGHDLAARETFAWYLVQRSLAAGAQGKLDEAIVWRLKALTIYVLYDERRAIAYLLSAWPKDDALVISQVAEGSSEALSPRGDRVLARTVEGYRLWDADTGRRIGDKGPLGDSRTYFNLDGRWINEISHNAVRVWSADAGREMGSYRSQERVTDNLVSPDGKYALASGWQWVKLWQVGTGQEVATVLRNAPRRFGQMAWSPDSQTFAIAHETQVWLWSVAKARELRTWDVRPWRDPTLRFDGAGERLIVHRGEEARVLDLSRTADEGLQVRHPESIDIATFTDDGHRLLLGGDTMLAVRNLDTGATERTWPNRCDTQGLTDLHLSEDGSITAVCGRNSVGQSADAATVTHLRGCITSACTGGAFDVGTGTPRALGKAGHGRLIVVRGYREKEVPRLLLPPDAGIDASADGRFLLAMSRRETIPYGQHFALEGQFWQVDPPERAAMEFHIHADKTRGLIAHEASNLAVIKGSYGFKLIDRRSGLELCQELFRGNTLDDVVPSLGPDGERVLLWAKQSVTLWDTGTCEQVGRVLTLEGQDPPEHITISNNGGRLTVIRKNEIEMWELGRAGIWPRIGRRSRTEPRILAGAEDWNRVVGEAIGWANYARLKHMPPPCWRQGWGLWRIRRDNQWIAAVLHGSIRVYRLRDCVEHGRVARVDGNVSGLSFANGDMLVAATSSWLHFLEVTPDGVAIRASRPLEEPPLRLGNVMAQAGPVTYRVLGEARGGVVSVKTVSSELPLPEVQDDPETLYQEWTQRLALELDAEGKMRALAH